MVDSNQPQFISSNHKSSALQTRHADLFTLNNGEQSRGGSTQEVIDTENTELRSDEIFEKLFKLEDGTQSQGVKPNPLETISDGVLFQSIFDYYDYQCSLAEHKYGLFSKPNVDLYEDIKQHEDNISEVSRELNRLDRTLQKIMM